MSGSMALGLHDTHIIRTGSNFSLRAGIAAAWIAVTIAICPAATLRQDVPLVSIQFAMGGATPVIPPPPRKQPSNSGGLTPQEQKMFADALNRLTPKERKRLAKALNRMTPEQRAQFAEGVKRQMAGRGTTPQTAKRR